MKITRYAIAFLAPIAAAYLSVQGFRAINKSAPFNIDVLLAFVFGGSGVGGVVAMALYSPDEKRVFECRLKEIAYSQEVSASTSIAALELLGTTNQKPR